MGAEKTGATGVGVVGPSATPLPSGKSDMGAEKTGATGVGAVGVGIRPCNGHYWCRCYDGCGGV